MAKLKSVPVVVSVMVLTLAWIPVSESLKKPVALARKEDQNGSVGEPETRCIEQERQALLKFKQHLHQIKVGFLSSWENENTDCCDWYGVQCSNESGHVTALDLSPSTNSFLPWPYSDEDGDRFLRGNITSWLLELKFLTYLDLSIVDFTGNQLPSFIGALTQLRYLNLSYTEMSGEIPPQLANLSSLQVLDLGYNYGLTMTNMEWVSHLSSLRILDLTQTNMSKATDWIQTVTKLPYLTNLVLSMCRLPNITIPSSISLVNTSKSLAILDLSNNRLSSSVYQLIFKFSRSLVHLNLFETRGNGSIPEAFLNMSALEYLELGANELEGFIPEALGNMSTLTYLGLSLNKFSGSIPEALGNLTNLTYIDIGSNNLQGEFPKSLWNLCKLRTLRAGENNLRRVLIPEQNQLLSRCTQYRPLEYLDFGQSRIIGPLPNLTLFSSLKVVRLYVNQFNGAVPEAFGRLTHLEELDLSSNSLKGVISAHLSKLSKLSRLGLSGNSLIWNITYDWVPPFKLDHIGLHSCKLGPRFPKWLQTQKDYSFLSISNAGISDSIPNWFRDISSNCYSMDLSANQIHGTITDSSFKFMGYPNVNLSSNELEGSIPHFMFKVGALDLSMNRFSKLDSLCNVSIDTELTFLDISLNQLSGDLPDCWFHFKELSVLVLANNKLSGKIPISIGSLTQITTMNFGSNSLSQELPSSLKRCTNLEALNVGENRLFGPMPTWIGESLPNLVILSLRSNHFFGSIPSNLCHLSHLSVLDLSLNNISGSIPKCLNNLTAMKARNESFLTTIEHDYSYGTSNSVYGSGYHDEVKLVWKGTLFVFRNTLGLVRSIDLSSNKLTGEIPTEITALVELVFLNLSRNSLSGEIPSKIGRLELLDGLHLSNNRLSGQVPSSLSQVDRLSILDLSNNNLSGKIPISTQLQSFEVSSYSGNPHLCGDPLPKWCPGDEPTINSRTHTVQNEEDQDKLVTHGFYFSLGLGFLVGLWGFCGTLFFNKTWRNSAF